MAASRWTTVVGPQRIGDGLGHLGRGVIGHQPRRDGGVRLGAGVVGREGCRDGGVPLHRRSVSAHRRWPGSSGPWRCNRPAGCPCSPWPHRCRHHGDGYLCPVEVVEECSGDGVVGLLRGVSITAEAEGPVVVGQGNAQAARGVEVADLVRSGQQVPGHVAGALTKLVAPPSIAISAKIPSMADCRVTCSVLSSAPVANWRGAKATRNTTG